MSANEKVILMQEVRHEVSQTLEQLEQQITATLAGIFEIEARVFQTRERLERLSRGVKTIHDLLKYMEDREVKSVDSELKQQAGGNSHV